MSNTKDSLEWVSHDEAREILALLEGVEKLILVGGQAVSFWAEELLRRGHIPPELDRIGVTAFREVHFKHIAPSTR